MPQTERLGTRAERRRAEILEAAEALFAERGFEATRLEDVAERVGIRRASLVYYFRDKQELYDAVLDDVFGDLYARAKEALSSAEPLPERAEKGVSAFVDFVATRPSFARILLREVANAGPDRAPAIDRQRQPFIDLVKREVFGREGVEELRGQGIDPVHLTSSIVGGVVFYMAAMPALVPDRGDKLLSPKEIDKLREQVLRIMRRVAGTRGPRLTGGR